MHGGVQHSAPKPQSSDAFAEALTKLMAEAEGKKDQRAPSDVLASLAEKLKAHDQRTTEDLGRTSGVVSSAALGVSSLPEPEEATFVDQSQAIEELSTSLGGMSTDNIHALLAEAMVVLIQSASEQSAGQREMRVLEMQDSVQSRLSGADKLRDSARSALITACVTSGIGMAVTVGGIGATVGSMKQTSAAQGLESQANALKNPDMGQLAGVSSGDTVSVTSSQMAPAGLPSIDAQKAQLMQDAAKKFQTAEQLRLGAQSATQLSATASGIGGAAASSQTTVGQAAHDEASALATQSQSLSEASAEWTGRMGAVRDAMLSILLEIGRTQAQSVSSAFRS